MAGRLGIHLAIHGFRKQGGVRGANVEHIQRGITIMGEGSEMRLLAFRGVAKRGTRSLAVSRMGGRLEGKGGAVRGMGDAKRNQGGQLEQEREAV